MIRKTETSRVCIVLENQMIKILDAMAMEKHETRSETIRRILTMSCDWWTGKELNKKTD